MIATTDDSAYAAGVALQEAGVVISAVADPRAEASDAARASGLPIRNGASVVATGGNLRVNRAILSNGEAHRLRSGSDVRRLDAVGASLFAVARQAAVRSSAGRRSCQANGPRRCARRARATAHSIWPHAWRKATPPATATGVRRQHAITALCRPWRSLSISNGKAFVDFQNDVTAKDLVIATQEGFRSIEHVKRYTTTGMATDQGKTSNMNALAMVAGLTNRPVPQVGHTTFRMPYTPVTFGALAGAARDDLFEPVRRTPIHDWAAAHGAVFENVGTWQRARWFPHSGEDMHRAVARECRAVRNAVGMFDATTLGKIEVVGPDAAEFLDRMYTGSFTRLAPGRCRYGVLLNEAGFVMDDGVVARLAPDRFHVTTTTGGAASVLHHMEDYRQTEFPELRVWLTSITEQWAVIAVQGPLARQVIAPLITDIDLAPDAMPHMSVREGRVCDIPARLFRVSFTGELGFEINVPADYGLAVWEAVHAAGEPHGITAYGTEAMHVLRAEKGYIIVGQETDGTVIPADLGLDWTIGTHQAGLRRQALADAARHAA